MNDKDTKEQKRRIRKLVEKWIVPLGLKWWRIDIIYLDESIRETKENERVIAQTIVNWEYLIATIQWDLRVTKTLDDDELEAAFVHELMHIFVNEMREGGTKHEERVCTQLERAFIWFEQSVRERHKQPV